LKLVGAAREVFAPESTDSGVIAEQLAQRYAQRKTFL
jgi:hypothetical protein